MSSYLCDSLFCKDDEQSTTRLGTSSRRITFTGTIEEQIPQQTKEMSSYLWDTLSCKDDDDNDIEESKKAKSRLELKGPPIFDSKNGDKSSNNEDSKSSSTRKTLDQLEPEQKQQQQQQQQEQEQIYPTNTRSHNRFRERAYLLPEESSGEDEDEESDDDDQPGAFHVDGMNSPATDDGTVQYSMGAPSEQANSNAIIQVQGSRDEEENLVVAELAPTTVEGTAVLLTTSTTESAADDSDDDDDDAALWKNAFSVLSILIFVIVIAAVVTSTVFFWGPNDGEAQSGEGDATEDQPTISPTQILSAGNEGDQEDPSSPPPPTTTPSLLPTTTNEPSLQPTISVMDFAIMMLSPYLTDIPSNYIQQQALDWLVTTDGEGIIATQDSDKLLDRFVLAILYYSLNGQVWNNAGGWLTQDVVCIWYIIVNSICDNDRVNTIYFVDNNLQGTIPTEIALLTTLTCLQFPGNNAIVGTLPTEIGMLTGLRDMDFLDAKIEGKIPTEIGLLTALTTLDFDLNVLEGTIPTDLFRLSAVTYLAWDKNNLTGTLPTEIGQLSSVRFLYFAENLLTGTIPTELARLTTLTDLSLYENNFTGTIPEELFDFLSSLPDGGCWIGCNPNLIGLPDNCLLC